MKPLKNYFFGN